MLAYTAPVRQVGVDLEIGERGIGQQLGRAVRREEEALPSFAGRAGAGDAGVGLGSLCGVVECSAVRCGGMRGSGWRGAIPGGKGGVGGGDGAMGMGKDVSLG